MKATDKLIEKIEDFARVCDFLDSVCCAIENNMELPNFIPMCNDSMLTDQLTKIAERLGKLPVWKMLKEGEVTPCRCYLMTLNGDITHTPMERGIKVGQDCYYLFVEDIRNLQKAL